MAEGNAVVGRVSIKVIPDTDGFAHKLKTGVEKEARKVDNVEIEADFDESGLSQKVNHAVDKAEAKAKKITVSTNVDYDSLKKAIARVEALTAKHHEIQISGKNSIKGLAKIKSKLDELQKASELKFKYNTDEAGLKAARERIVAVMREKAQLDLAVKTDDASLQAELARIDKELEKFVTQPDQPKITLEVETDREGLRKNLDIVNKELKRLTNPKVHIDLDEESLRKAKAEIEEQLKSPRAMHLKVDNNIQGLKEARAKVDKMLGEKNQFDFTVQTDEESLKRFRKHLDGLIDDYDGTNILFDLDISAPTYQYAAARLAQISRDRFVHLYPVVNSQAYMAAERAIAALSGGRLLTATLDNVWQMLKNMDKNIPLIGSLALAVAGLGNSALSATSNLFGIARSLAQISGAALVLPGILGGFAVGIGASIAVLKDFNERLPEVKKQLSALQDQMSSKFWKEAQKPFRNFVNTVFPEFSAGIRESSTALGRWFGSFADSLTEHLGDGALKQMFENLNRSIVISSHGTDSWAKAIEILGRRGSEYLPRLAVWFNDVTDKFTNWLDEADKNGKLTEWIDEGIKNFNALGRVIKESGRILGGFGRAANEAGGSSLTSLAAKLKSIADTVNGAHFQEHLVQAFRAAHLVMDDIARVSGPSVEAFFERITHTMEEAGQSVGPAIGMLIKGIADAFTTEAFNEGIVSLFEGIERAVVRLTPMWKPLGDAIGAVLELMGNLSVSFAPLLTELFIELGSLAERLGPKVASIADELSGSLLGVLETLAPAIVVVADVFAWFIDRLAGSTGAIVAVTAAIIGIRAALAAGKIAESVMKITDQFGKFAKTAPHVTDAMGKFGKAAGKAAGIAGLAFIGVHLLDIATNSGTAAAGLDMTSRSMTALADQISRPDTVTNLFAIDEQFRNINDAMGALTGNAAVTMAMGLDSFLGTNLASGANAAAEQFKQIDETLATLVASGQADEAARQFQALYGTVDQSRFSTEQLMALMPSYDLAMVNHGIATSEVAAASRVAEAAQKDFAAAVERVGGFTPDMISGLNEASKAFVNFDGATGEAYTGLDNFMAQLDKQISDQRAWADNMVALSKAGMSDGLYDELARMGPASADLVKDLWEKTAGGDGSYLAKMEEGFKAKSEGAAGNVETEFGKLSQIVTEQVAPAAQAATDAMAGLESAMATRGNEAVAGFQQSLANGIPGSWNGGYRNARAVLEGTKAGLNSNSPSKEMIALGHDATDGLVIGLLDQIDDVRDASRKIAEAVRSETEQDIEMGLSLSARTARGAMADTTGSGGNAANKTLNYYAAPGSSLGSEEDLFAATNRGRFIF